MRRKPAAGAEKSRKETVALPAAAPSRFAAIDFETADYSRDSACALSVVVVDNNKIVHKENTLIRPPRRDFVFTYLHGISWRDVAKKERFPEIWPAIREKLDGFGIHYFAAHNARFDKSVLHECCQAADMDPPFEKFLCTVKLARKAWGIFPTKLSDVCRKLKIPLKHHDALSDAMACAQIVIRASEEGFDISSMFDKGKRKTKAA
jgi:DNA polymerase-3 subunit epsilon